MSTTNSDNLEIVYENQSHCSIRYKESVLMWNTLVFWKTAYSRNPIPLFPEINAYFKTLPQKTQAQLFELYQQLHVSLERNLTAAERIREMRPIIIQLSRLLDMSALVSWTKVSANVIIPASFAREFIDPRTTNRDIIQNFEEPVEDDEEDEEEEVLEDDAPSVDEDGEPIIKTAKPEKKVVRRQTTQAGTREKTYLRDDYIGLVALTIGFRALFPVFGEFLTQTERETGTSFKEFYTGTLLEGSDFEDSVPYQKLSTYVEHNIQQDQVRPAAIMDMVSVEDFPRWTLYMVIIRRITIGDIRGIGSDTTMNNNHLVTYIHSYITERIIKHENNFAINRIRSKTATSSPNTDEESKLTVFETVKVSEEFSPGDIIEIGVYSTDIDMMVRELCPDLPRALVNQALEAIKALENERIHKHQERLIKWLIGPYLPPSSLMVMDKLQALNLAAVCQAMLWYRGFHDIAIILTLTHLPRSETLTITNTVSRSHIPRAMSEELNRIYKHVRRPGRSQDVSKRDSVVHELIRDTVLSLYERDWKMNIHPEWEATLPRQSGTRRRDEYIIPGDIRAHLARLAIRIGRNPRPFHSDAIVDEIG